MSDSAHWISVGELAEAFGPNNNTPPQTAALAGSAHILHFEDGGATEYRFLSERRLAWSEAGKATCAPAGAGGQADYFALEPRAGVFFVDFVMDGAPPTAVSLVMDLDRRIATRLTARLPGSADIGESLAARVARGDELTAVEAEFASAAVDATFRPGDAAAPAHRRPGGASGGVHL